VQLTRHNSYVTAMCGHYSCNCIVNALRTFRNVQVTQDSGSLVRTQDADDFQRNDPVVLEESHELTIRLQWVSGVAGHLSSRCSMILNLLSRGLSAYFYLIPPLPTVKGVTRSTERQCE